MTRSQTIALGTTDHNDASRILALLGTPFRVVFDPSRNLEGDDYWVTKNNAPVSTHPSLAEALAAIGSVLTYPD